MREAAPPAMTIIVWQVVIGLRLTSVAARSQLSSAARNHSSSASWIASSGSPAKNGSRSSGPTPIRSRIAQRRPVEHVVGQDVAGLVAEHGAQLVLVHQADRAGVEHDHRLLGADRHRVGERHLPDVEIRDLLDVQPRQRRPVRSPDLRQLVLAEPDRARRAAPAGSSRSKPNSISLRTTVSIIGICCSAAVAARSAGCSYAFGEMSFRRWSSGRSMQSQGSRSLTRITNCSPLQISSMAATLLSTSRFASAISRTTSSVMSVGRFERASARRSTAARSAPSARAGRACAARGRGARCGS